MRVVMRELLSAQVVEEIASEQSSQCLLERAKICQTRYLMTCRVSYYQPSIRFQMEKFH